MEKKRRLRSIVPISRACNLCYEFQRRRIPKTTLGYVRESIHQANRTRGRYMYFGVGINIKNRPQDVSRPGGDRG